jgi:putative transposase
MSGVGNLYLKAQTEHFMRTLKVEDVYCAGCGTFANVATRLHRDIEQFYDAKRLHSAPGNRPPEELENQFAGQL